MKQYIKLVNTIFNKCNYIHLTHSNWDQYSNQNVNQQMIHNNFESLQMIVVVYILGIF